MTNPTTVATKENNGVFTFPEKALAYYFLGIAIGLGLGTVVGSILLVCLGETETEWFDGPDGPERCDVLTDKAVDFYLHRTMGYGALVGFLLATLACIHEKVKASKPGEFFSFNKSKSSDNASSISSQLSINK